MEWPSLLENARAQFDPPAKFVHGHYAPARDGETGEVGTNESVPAYPYHDNKRWQRSALAGREVLQHVNRGNCEEVLRRCMNALKFTYETFWPCPAQDEAAKSFGGNIEVVSHVGYIISYLVNNFPRETKELLTKRDEHLFAGYPQGPNAYVEVLISFLSESIIPDALMSCMLGGNLTGQTGALKSINVDNMDLEFTRFLKDCTFFETIFRSPLYQEIHHQAEVRSKESLT